MPQTLRSYWLLIVVVTCSFVVSVPALCLAEEESQIYDPWEGYNRGMFWFNDKVDIYLLEPVATGYDYVAPIQSKKSSAISLIISVTHCT